MKQLQAGFDLGWSVECRDCSLAGKSCGVDARDLNLGTKPLPYQCEQASAEYKEPTELQIILIYVGIALGALIGVVLIVVLLVLRIRNCKKPRQNVQQSYSFTLYH
ncbi:hypothetical protein M0R45_021805 [Rubus argutus]|uniref:Uncharacterized protein n=1 Tax=Rubus argutus TaxID=59490 RepID=A0AAW1XDQ2_RUBAR